MNAMTRQEVGLRLTREQCSLIVEGLAERPFRQVYELIGHLHAASHAADDAVHFVLAAAQVRMILESLGAMPFGRVSRLLQTMHQQLRLNT